MNRERDALQQAKSRFKESVKRTGSAHSPLPTLWYGRLEEKLSALLDYLDAERQTTGHVNWLKLPEKEISLLPNCRINGCRKESA